MPRFGFVGGSYTSQGFGAVADEECINLFGEINEAANTEVAFSAYGGRGAAGIRSYFGTPGLKLFAAFPAGPVRGSVGINGRVFFVADTGFYELGSDATITKWGTVPTDGNPASMCSNGLQVLIVSASHAYCFTLSANAWKANTAYQVGNTILDPDGHIQKATAAAWAADTEYAVGQQIVDPNGNIQQAQQNQWTASTAYAPGVEIVDAAGHVQKAFARGWSANSAYAFGSTIVDSNGNIQEAFAAAWVANQAYAVGTAIVDSNGNIQTVTTAGTSGSTVPAWNTSGNTADNSVVWTYQSSASGQGTTGAAVPVWTTGITIDNLPLYWVYQGSANGSAGTSGTSIPAFNDAGGAIDDGTGTLVWIDQGLASGAGTSGATEPIFLSAGTTSDNGSLSWLFIAASNGSAGTSGGAIPAFNDAGGTTPDANTLIWQDMGARFLEVTPQLQGAPLACDGSDTYAVVIFQNSNKYQISQFLDFTTWPGQLVGEPSVFPDNLTSIKFNHREMWLFGNEHTQPYQDTGSTEVFDIIQGAMIETGSAATFGVARLDNSLFWVTQDERGGASVARSSNYTPTRVSTHAVEDWLSRQTNLSQLVAYSFQQRGHWLYQMYVPGGDCSWVYDVGEALWHKRAAWNSNTATWQPHWSWNHVFAFGKHLVGDWNSGNVYELAFDQYTDNGTPIRRLRQSPTLGEERQWQYHAEMIVDFAAGLGPQPPLLDGDGNEREPQALLSWSNDKGRTWSNLHARGTGFAGDYNKPVHWMRLGRSRNRVYRLEMTDAVPWAITDAYLDIVGAQ